MLCRPMLDRLPRLTLRAAACAALLASPLAWAVHPASWRHVTEDDFAAGEVHDAVVTSAGRVQLSAASEQVAATPESATIYYDLQPMPDGRVYLAAGAEARLLVEEKGQVREIAHLPGAGEQIFCLDRLGDKLLVGISGAHSRLALLDGDKLVDLVSFDDLPADEEEKPADDDKPDAPADTQSVEPQDGPPADTIPAGAPAVRYVWDLLVDGKTIYVATGDRGRVLRVDVSDKAKPAVTTLLKAKQPNVLCLGRDDAGRLYAGTDQDGLVYRLTPPAHGSAPGSAGGDMDSGDSPWSPFVLYDAKEPEIAALLVMPDGAVYAGTADADQAKPERMTETDAEQTGQPEPESATPSVDEMPSADDEEMQAEESTPPTPEAPAPESAAPPEQAEPTITEPTAAQRDELRQEIRKRLEKARGQQAMKVASGSSRSASRSTSGSSKSSKSASHDRSAGGSSRSSSSSDEGGNAVYRIKPDGLVTEVFRESVMILRLMPAPASIASPAPGSGDAGESAETGGLRLLVATGNEGQIYLVDPQTGLSAILADLDPQQVLAMAPLPVKKKDKHPGASTLPGGDVLLATANPAQLLRLGGRFADQGSFTSDVLDAEQVSLWGKMEVSVYNQPGAAVAVQTRSGNAEDPDAAPWSDWSAPVELQPRAGIDNPLLPHSLDVGAPPARFLQYRLNFTSKGDATGSVAGVEIHYVVPNQKPVIESLKSEYPEPSSRGSDDQSDQQPRYNLKLSWEASDPNEDTLTYRLEYRGNPTAPWLVLAKDLTDTEYEWDTRQSPDGRYQVRLIADDRADNPGAMALSASRIGDPVIVDNTPPTIKDLKVDPSARQVRLRAKLVDAVSAVAAVHYRVDSSQEWKPALPADLIFDSTEETLDVNMAGLRPGTRVITLRVADALGNVLYQTIQAQVPQR
ncbi:MAG: hypothetical protein IT442_06915 [Phycisphaeraceae bacterium]|nr:hypothetical protein [Phycisphaeraceae bacterium]